MTKRYQASASQIIETKNLLLGASRGGDIDGLYAFLGDRQAMRYTHVDPSYAACRKRILVHEWLRRRDGFAPWVIRQKSDHQIVGWGGIYTDPFDPGWGPEIGYYFHPDVWGRGFGGELVTTALWLAEHQYALPELTAFAHPENIPSRRLLEKYGFAMCDFVKSMNRYRFKRVF